MATRHLARPILAAALLAVGAAGWAAPAQAPTIAAIGKIERGQWQLRDSDGTRRSLCVADPAVLLQIRHRGTSCSRFVIDNSPNSATVHYTCPGSGHARTTLTVETPRLLRIESQGLEGGAPFAVEIEARKTGRC